SESNSEDRQYRIMINGNVLTVELLDEEGNRYEIEIENFFRVEEGNNSIQPQASHSGNPPENLYSSGLTLQNQQNELQFFWTHISLVVDPDNELIQFYRNGFEVKRLQLFAPLQSSQANFEVGRGFGFDGELHEIRLWDRPRTRTEIQAAKDLILNGTENNLVMYHTFDDVTDLEKATDLTQNGNHFYLGPDVERRSSLRNRTRVTVQQDEDFIILMATIDETGGPIAAEMIRLPEHGQIFQINEQTDPAGVISRPGTFITDPKNRSLYKPDPEFIGQDSIRYKLYDQHGNFREAIMEFEILKVNRPPVLSLIGDPTLEPHTGRLVFDQRDSIRFGLDTLVTDNMYTPDQMTWELQVVDSRQEKVCLTPAPGSTSTGTIKFDHCDRLESQNGASGTGSEQFLVVKVDEISRIITLTTTPLFHDTDLRLRLTVFDPEELSGRRDFLVTVNEVNDPPEPFDLLQPADNDRVPINFLSFSWMKTSTFEEEPIDYSIHWLRDDGASHSEEMLPDTTYTVEDPAGFFESGRSYTWWVIASDGTAETESRSRHTMHITEKVIEYNLKQNFPNPFRGSTTIEYWLPVRSQLVITIYDVLGRPVETVIDDATLDPGIYRRTFQGGHLASGVYFIRMVAKGEDGSRSLIVRQMTYIR
ncbi:MAG: LamG-like jellyroll fold domain-containing protein, partial [Balneolales bacterium]